MPSSSEALARPGSSDSVTSVGGDGKDLAQDEGTSRKRYTGMPTTLPDQENGGFSYSDSGQSLSSLADRSPSVYVTDVDVCIIESDSAHQSVNVSMMSTANQYDDYQYNPNSMATSNQYYYSPPPQVCKLWSGERERGWGGVYVCASEGESE